MNPLFFFYCFQKVAQLLSCFFQCTGSFQAFASSYQAAAGHQKIQPQEMRIWGLGLRNCFREFSGACALLSGRSRPPKNPDTENENLGLGLRNCFREFSGIASPYLAAAGHQKIQPQQMRIWPLGLRNCFREFSGTCVPLSGRSRPPKNPATGNENLGLGLAKLV